MAPHREGANTDADPRFPRRPAHRNRVNEIPPLKPYPATSTREFLRPRLRDFLASVATARRLWRRLPHRLGFRPLAPGILGAFCGGDPARRRAAWQSRGTEAAPSASYLASRCWLVGGRRAAVESGARRRRLEHPARRRHSGCRRDDPWGRVLVPFL